jgi:hypothetical protein
MTKLLFVAQVVLCIISTARGAEAWSARYTYDSGVALTAARVGPGSQASKGAGAIPHSDTWKTDQLNERKPEDPKSGPRLQQNSTSNSPSSQPDKNVSEQLTNPLPNGVDKPGSASRPTGEARTSDHDSIEAFWWCGSPKSHPRRKWRESVSPQRELQACTRPRFALRTAKVLLNGKARAWGPTYGDD